jgi:predicted flap endonuclease-1-like 5' DNA nuclease
MNLLAMHIPCWLIPLLVGAICALLGYLLGRLLGGSNKEEEFEVIDVLKNRITQLESDLKRCNSSKLNLATDLKTAKSANLEMASSFSGATATLNPFDAGAAKAVFGKKIKENDLKIVEGIGPKIEGLFHNFDIKNWKDLGEASVEKCQEVLNSGGDRYRIHKPNTWPKQAKLAYEGKWVELLKWQDELDGGK